MRYVTWALGPEVWPSDSEIEGLRTGRNQPAAKHRFNEQFPEITIPFYQLLTRKLLLKLYPKFCEGCGEQMTGSISTRENVVVCTNCKTHKSITSYSPLHHLKLPLWVFGYLVTEQITQHPLPISGEQIRRRLGVAKNTSCLLKKRLMLFWSDVLPLIREKFTEERDQR